MALNTYANLKSSVANWLGRSDLTNEIGDFVKLCEQDFNAKLVNHGYNRMINEATIVANAESEDLPTGFLGVNSIYVDGSSKKSLNYVTPQQAFSSNMGSQNGEPSAYTIINSKIYFYPIPSTSYDVKMFYYKQFTSLASDSDTNDILTNHPDIYLFGTLYFSNTFIRGIDPNITKEWLAYYNNALERCVTLNQRDKYNQDTPLIMRSSISGE